MKINKIVLDSSIFNKIYLQEEDSDKVIDYLERINEENYTILAPSIFLYEVLSVASSNKYDSKLVYDLIIDYQLNNLQIVNPDNKIIDKALEIANSGHVKSGFPSFYDCAYHALAIINKCNFITADKKHYQKTKELGHIKLL